MSKGKSENQTRFSDGVLFFAREILLVIGVALAFLLRETSYAGYSKIFGLLLAGAGVYAICGYRFRKQRAYVGYLLAGIALMYWGAREFALGNLPSFESSLAIVDPIFMILAVVGGVLAMLLRGPGRG